MNAINLFGKMLAFSRLQINTTDVAKIVEELDSLSVSPDIVPVVLDSCHDVEIDQAFFDELIDTLWQRNIAIIAVMGDKLGEFAKVHKMAVLPDDGKRIMRLTPKSSANITSADIKSTDKNTDVTKIGIKHASQTNDNHLNSDNLVNNPIDNSKLVDDKADQTAQTVATIKSSLATINPSLNSASSIGMGDKSLVHEQMLRSGQSVHHIGGDLIVTNSVNKGAEVVTDNNLHIYGKGQGRLVAGATGDETTRIFCQVFEPSLVSVAGTYCLHDDIPQEFIGQAVQVTFEKNKGLVFKLM